MAGDGILRNAHDHRAGGREVCGRSRKALGLGRAATGVILGIEIEDDCPAAERSKAYLAVGAGKIEQWGFVARFQLIAHRKPLLSRRHYQALARIALSKFRLRRGERHLGVGVRNLDAVNAKTAAGDLPSGVAIRGGEPGQHH